MNSITERLASRGATVFVASDSFDPLVARLTGIICGDPQTPELRKMTVIRHYLHRPEHLDVATSLSLDPDRHPEGHLTATAQQAPLGRHFHVGLAPGIRGFGFSLYAADALSEEQTARRYHSTKSNGPYDQRRRDLTVVTFDGWAGQPCRDDRIEIEEWNTPGVGTRTVIAFEASTWEIEAEQRRREWLR